MGPLCFKPKPNSPSQLLLFSPSFFPPLPPPFTRLSLHFLSQFHYPSFPLPFPSPLSLALNVLFLSHNRLQCLVWTGKDAVVVFFPTGSNHDQIGFLVLSVEDSNVNVRVAGNDDVLVAKERFNYRIVRILVNQVDDFAGFSNNSVVTFGYAMASTTYSVHWHGVKSSECSQRPV